MSKTMYNGCQTMIDRINDVVNEKRLTLELKDGLYWLTQDTGYVLYTSKGLDEIYTLLLGYSAAVKHQ